MVVLKDLYQKKTCGFVVSFGSGNALADTEEEAAETIQIRTIYLP